MERILIPAGHSKITIIVLIIKNLTITSTHISSKEKKKKKKKRATTKKNHICTVKHTNMDKRNRKHNHLIKQKKDINPH